MAEKKKTGTTKTPAKKTPEKKISDKPAPKVKQITIDGLTMKVNPRVIQDYRVQRTVVALGGYSQDEIGDDPKKVTQIFDAVERVLGAEFDRVIEHLEKSNDGIAPIEDVTRYFTTIVQKLSPNS